jgi:arylsulfatase A-like enzyme
MPANAFPNDALPRGSSKAARLCAVGLATLALAVAAPAAARDQFNYTMRREIRAVDAKSGAEMPFADQKVGRDSRRTLGVTGRVAIARRPVLVEEGGQIFVHAMMPEALASAPQDLDILIDGKDGMRVRGSIHYEPGQSRRVARLFVLPELEPGPALVEVHVRGAHVAEWQEIVTEEVVVPPRGRLHFGWSLEGKGGRPGVQMVVEARPAAGEKDTQVVTLFSDRATGAAGRWEEEEEDLRKLAGRRVRFAFRSRPASSDAKGAPGVVWGAPAIEIEEKRRAYPIVAVVSLDSLRATAVGLYAGGTATPFLDEWFGPRRGAVMTNASTQSVTTLPSHLTLMTGLNPLSHGVVDEKRSLGRDVRTLAQAMQEAGWHTAAFTEGGALAGELGFRRGFDVYDEGASAEIDPSTSDAVQRATRWLDDYSGAPLFLFVHTYATRPVHLGVDGSSDPRVRSSQLGAYVRQVRIADEAVGKLFGAMKGRILDDEALFVVLSGHGEEFFEHGAVGHGTHLYEETMRVPLMFRGGRVEETGAHQLPVGVVDVAPTILELTGVRAAKGMQGRSFARLVQSGRAVATAPRFSEARRPVRLTSAAKLQLWGPPAFAMRDGSKKVIWNSGSNGSIEAYDLSADPRELRNLATPSSMPEWARRMAASLRNYPQAAARGVRAGGKADLSPANRSRLESLGYAR